MEKDQIDELYHLLRVVSNGGISTEEYSKTGRTQSEVNNIFHGLSRHLLAGGDYDALIQFLAYYGTRFVISPVCKGIDGIGLHPQRIVELGAGLGWFGRGISAHFDNIPCVFIDKRTWPLIDIVADLETASGMGKVLSGMKDGDLVVASDFLHCVDNPKEVMAKFSKWPMAILEYLPTDEDYADSYNTQIKRYGATPIEPERFEDMFPGRSVDIIDIDPHVLMLVGQRDERLYL